jgi:hypothetical protein
MLLEMALSSLPIIRSVCTFVFFPLDLGRKYYENPCSHNVSL